MKRFVKKYFIPNEENEYVPHIMRRASIGALSFLALLIFFGGILNVVVIKETSLLSAVIPKSLVELANNNRLQNKVNTLSQSEPLVLAAQKKADDMAAKGYFAHTSPDGKSPWHWFKEAGYDFQYAGENLAINFVDSVDVDSAWMNSPGHRLNILNGKFTEVGIATAKGYYNGRETIFVVQMFGKPLRTSATRFAKEVFKPQVVQAKTSTTTPTTTPKTFPKPALKPLVATTSTTTLQKTTKPPRVLGETDTYIEAEVALEDIVQGSEVAQGQEQITQTNEVSFPLEMLASPKKTIQIIYLVLGGFVLIALMLMIGIELRKQHPKYIGLGISLLILISFLAFIFRAVLFPEVIVL